MGDTVLGGRSVRRGHGVGGTQCEDGTRVLPGCPEGRVFLFCLFYDPREESMASQKHSPGGRLASLS